MRARGREAGRGHRRQGWRTRDSGRGEIGAARARGKASLLERGEDEQRRGRKRRGMESEWIRLGFGGALPAALLLYGAGAQVAVGLGRWKVGGGGEAGSLWLRAAVGLLSISRAGP
jgi:hypothetical protein